MTNTTTSARANLADSSIAVCDPKIIASAIFSDESAYQERGVSLRMSWDVATLPTLLHVALLFDTVIADPLLIMGLKPILGYNFLELFGNTIKKVQDCGFVAFNPKEFVPEKEHDRLNKLQKFLSDVQDTERSVKAIANDTSVSFAGTMENALLYSTIGGLPFVGSNGRIQAPTGPSQHPAPSDSRPFTVLSQILSIELPKLQVQSLDDVLDIRATSGATDFRHIMRELVATLSTEFLDEHQDIERIITKWNEVKNQAVDVLANEFRSEVSGWSPVKAGFSVLLDIAGFIPGVSVASGSLAAAKDVAQFLNALEKRTKLKEVSFLSFLTEVRAGYSEEA